MATISLKKKTGGTAVGNAIRSVVGAIKGIGGASQTGSAMKFPVGQGLTDKQTANANKALGISKTTTGGLTYNTSQAQTIQNAKFSKPQAITNADINKAVKSGGITQPVKYSQYVGGNSNKNTGGFTALSTSGSLNPDMTGGESGITTLRSGLSSTSGLGGTNSIVSPNSSIPSSNIINTQKAGLANNEFNYPDPGKVDYSFTPITIDQERLNLENEQKKTEDNYLKNLLKDFQEKESASEIDARLQRELGIKEKQQRVSSLSEQLNTIVNRGQANQLSLIGQGRGIPEAIIGGQQAQIGRETAIAALPVQAQLSAAQGDLEMANDSLDRLFKIYSDEADNNFAFKKEVNSFLYQSATAKQKKKLEDIDKKEERRYQEQKEDFKQKTELATLITKYGASANLISSVLKSPNYTSALTLKGITQYLNDPLDRRLKIAQINKAEAEAGQAKNLSKVIGLDPTSKKYTEQMIDASKGGRTLTQSEVLPITKGLTVVNQIGSLQQTLKGQNTGPILGILRGNNPYDVKAKLINAQLQALIPNLARGVYGEVGVLTNQDIDNYKQTLGNIKTTEDANNLLLAMTLSTIKSSIDNNLQTMAAAGRDVSGFKGIYSNLNTKLDTLNSNLGVRQISNTANSYLDSVLPQDKPVDSGPVNWLNTFFYGKKNNL